MHCGKCKIDFWTSDNKCPMCSWKALKDFLDTGEPDTEPTGMAAMEELLSPSYDLTAADLGLAKLGMDFDAAIDRGTKL